MDRLQSTQGHPIYTIDLNFLGFSSAIATYLVPHKEGALLVECGPGSTVPNLLSGLNSSGYSVADISDVLVTHIHLDHAGASGWFAKSGARIHVHPIGAPHLINPEKLLASAERIYGEEMERLWGEFLPVPEEQLIIHQDKDYFEIGDLGFYALDTPGHANHHFVYIFEKICFCGDIGGVRMPGSNYVRLPMPPPEFHLEKWRHSLDVLRHEEITHILPTHFGSYSDPGKHLLEVENALNDVDEWMEEILPHDFPLAKVQAEFLHFEEQRAQAAGVEPNLRNVYETANPAWMSVHGINRYWKKYRQRF
jgi:glyoxylase-like metal-dependent hydrolase (beta-lactamase superfamily II)